MRYLRNAALATSQDERLFDGMGGSGRWAGEQIQRHGYKLSSLRLGDTLRRDEWRFIMDTLVEEGVIRIGFVDRLLAAGLGVTVPNAFGKTEIEFEKVTDMQPAEVSMDGLARSKNDRVLFSQTRIPNPIVHKDFFMSRRVIDASRERGEPLPTTQIRFATRKVLEKVDDLALNGGGPQVNGNQGYGVLNHPSRNVMTFSNGLWVSGGASGEDKLTDVQLAMDASRAARHYGPWLLVIPAGFEGGMGSDFKSQSDKTVRSRLLELAGLQDIVVLDQMPANEMALIELQRETLEVANGEAPQPIQWDIEGGMGVNFKVLAIRNLIVKADAEGRSGIVQVVPAS